VKQFSDYIHGHPAELREQKNPPWLPEKPLPPAVRVLTPPQWVAERTAEAEQLLWRKTCKECHSLVFAPGQTLPAVPLSAITPRWLPHALFDHEAHRLVQCTACHAAITSQATADVLIPGVETCRECHHTGAQGAESECFECHVYHDWRQRKDIRSRFTMSELVRG